MLTKNERKALAWSLYIKRLRSAFRSTRFDFAVGPPRLVYEVLRDGAHAAFFGEKARGADGRAFMLDPDRAGAWAELVGIPFETIRSAYKRAEGILLGTARTAPVVDFAEALAAYRGRRGTVKGAA